MAGPTREPERSPNPRSGLPARPADLAPVRAPTPAPLSRPAALSVRSPTPALAPAPPIAAQVLALQKGAGNAAVTRLLGPPSSAASRAAPQPSPVPLASAVAPASTQDQDAPASGGGIAPPVDPAALAGAPLSIVTTGDAIQQQTEAHRTELAAAFAAAQGQSAAETAAAAAGIDARMTAEIAALDGRIKQRKAEIQAHITGATTQIGSTLARRSAEAKAAGPAARRALAGTVTAGKSQARTAAGEQAGLAQQQGSAEASRAVSTSADLQQSVRAAAQRASAAGSNPDERQAAGEAVNQTASDVTRDMRSKSGDLAAEVRRTSTELARSIRTAGDDLVSKLGSDEKQLGDQLDQSAQTTAQQISTLGKSQTTQLADAGRQAAAALDRLKIEAVNRIRTAATLAKRQVADRGRQANRATVGAGQAADQQLAAGGAAAITALSTASGRGRAAGRVRQFGEAVGQQLQSAAVDAAAGLDRLGQARSRQFGDLAGGFDTTLREGSTTVDEQIGTISGNVGGAAAQTTTAVVSSADQVMSDLTTTHSRAVGDFGSGLNQQVNQAAQTWASEREGQVSSLRGEVDSQLGGHREAEQRAPGQLAEVAQTAVTQVNESTWSKIGRGIWNAIKKFGEGLLILLGLTLLVFGVLLLAGLVVLSVKGFLIALAVAGILLLVYSVVTGFMDRWEQYRKKFGDQPWWADALAAVGIAVLSVGGAFGITQLLEGATGYDFVTGDELDAEQRAERITEGVLTIATLLIFRSVAKRVPIGEGLTPRGRKVVAGLVDAFNRLTGRKSASKGGKKGPEEPVPVPLDPYARLGQKFNLRPDIVETMRNSKADPVLLDRLLSRGLDAERVALVAAEHGPNGLATLDALTAQGVSETVSVRLIEEAASLGRLAELRTLAERGVVRRLLDRGFRTDEIVLLVDEVGVAGVETIDGLTGQAVSKPVAIDAARIAARIGAAAEVRQLSQTGALENPAGLRNFLLEVEAELRTGQQGKLTTLRDAAQRTGGGQVALEQSSRARTESGDVSGADIIDHGRREAIQQKVVTGRSRPDATNPVTTNLEKAASQLRGESGETPPAGYQRIIDIRVTEPSNAMFPLERAALLEALRADGVNQTTLRGVDQVRVTNGTGTHAFAPSEF